MTALRQYLIGLGTAGILGLAAASLAEPSVRSEVRAGVSLNQRRREKLCRLLVQAPLGWWTLRSIGTEKFQSVWVGGMIFRFAVVAVAALVLAPVYRWDTGPVLLALVATLLVLLLVEAVTAMREHSTTK